MRGTRRGFMAGATALASGLGATALAQTRPSGAVPMINTLGGLSDPNDTRSSGPTWRPARPTRRMIDDALASGVSGINMTLGYVFGDADPYAETVSQLDEWDATIAQTPELLKVLSAADIERARAEGKLGLIYGFQNASMMGDDLDRVDAFQARGVRVVQLTYNDANQVGSGALAPNDTGLTPFGRSLVERLNDKRVIIDLSHSGQATCLDAARTSKTPISITHTGCRALVDLPRNKSDEELRLVASRGGFVGIYFMPFLALGRQATADDVVAHIEHAVQVCGEDHVGVGTDGGFTPVDDIAAYRALLAKVIEGRRAAGISAPGESPDIFPFVLEMQGPDQFRELGRRLAQRGHTQTRIDKILGGNFLRYSAGVWGG